MLMMWTKSTLTSWQNSSFAPCHPFVCICLQHLSLLSMCAYIMNKKIMDVDCIIIYYKVRCGVCVCVDDYF